MSEANLRFWYREAMFVLCLVGFAVAIYVIYFRPQEQFVDMELTGHLSGVLSPGSFELEIWHQHPGNLRNGKLTVWVEGKSIPRGKQTKIHSFESWGPNRASAARFSFPLEDYDPSEPLVVKYLLESVGNLDTPGRFVWQGNGWK